MMMSKILKAGSCALILLSSNAFSEDLLGVYQKAVLADPTLQLAKLKIQVGDAQQGQAGGALLPQINASGGISKNYRQFESKDISNRNYEGMNYNISVTQSLMDVPKYWNWKKHQKITEQYQAEGLSAEQTLLFDVVDRYFSVLEEADNLLLVEKEKIATEKKVNQLQKQYAKRVIKITDVLDMEAELDGIKAYEIEVQTTYSLARERLFELTGQTLGDLQPLSTSIDYQPLTGNINTWIEKTKVLNPDINAKKKAIAVADDFVAEQKSRHLPTIDFRFNHYMTDTGFQGTQQPKSDTQVVGLNVTLPIFSGGTTYYQTKEANYQKEMAKQEHIGVLRETIKETRDAFLTTNASYRKIKSSLKFLESAEKSRDAMIKGFKHGVNVVSDIINSETRVFKAKRDLLQAKYAYIKHKMRFKRVTGDISYASLEEINSWLQK